MEISGKKVGVFGLGITGKAVVNFLNRHNAHIIAVDETEDANRIFQLKQFAKNANIPLHCGDFDPQVLLPCDLLVVSPGIDLKHKKLEFLREKKIPIIGEIELGYLHCSAPIIAVTGSNGKTTTAALTHHILNGKFNAYLAGNIGKAFVDIADRVTADDIVCLEVSSFQLETCIHFAPKVAIITNITPDHLDRHTNFENYAELKRSIIKNMREGDYLIYNAEDENLQPELFDEAEVTFIPFSGVSEVGPPGAYVSDGMMLINVADREVRIPTSALKVPGNHNIENALSALSAARLMGVSKAIMTSAIMSFKGYEHRLEFVREVGNVKYFNDSKATNPEASIVALKSFTERIVLIAGGRDKGTNLSPWAQLVKAKCKTVILIGEATERFEKALRDAGFLSTQRAKSMEEAVKRAGSIATAGDVVLLSPACSSFDMFQDFEERGNIFKELVTSL